MFSAPAPSPHSPHLTQKRQTLLHENCIECTGIWQNEHGSMMQYDVSESPSSVASNSPIYTQWLVEKSLPTPYVGEVD